MDLLFVSATYPDRAHPARGTYNASLCRALAEEHAVRVVSPRPWLEHWGRSLRSLNWQTPEHDLRAGISVEYPCYYFPPRIHSERYGAWMWWSCRRTFDRLIQDRPPGGVLSYWIHPDGDAALQLARKCGIPSVVIVGGSDALLLPRCPKRGREICRVLQESDAIVTISEGLRQSVLRLGIPADRVHVIHQGIDPRLFSPGSQAEARRTLGLPHDGELLLWVGRMVGVKRLDVLLAALSRVRENCPRVRLCLIGTGPCLKSARVQAEQSGLAGNVQFVGSISPEHLGDWYRAADLTLLSSDSEGLPNVLRESLACGTPYVTTDVGDIREVDGGMQGWFAPPGNPALLAESILQALQTVQQRQACGIHLMEPHAVECEPGRGIGSGPGHPAVRRSARLPEVQEFPPPRTWRDMASEVTRLFEQLQSRRQVLRHSSPEPCRV